MSHLLTTETSPGYHAATFKGGSMKRFLTFTILFLLTIAFMSQSCSRTDEKKAPPTGNKTVSVTFTSPTESVYRPHSVVASFDRAIVPITTIGRLKEKGPLNISPKTPGSFHWLGTQTVSFVPDKPFPFATAYAVKIDPDLTDIQGDGLTEPVSWAFETARPTLISSTPEDGAIHAELDQKLLLYFNQPIDPGTVAKHMTMTMKDNEGDVQLVQPPARRPSKEEWKDETRELDRTVIITPEKQLNESSTIKMALDKSLTGMEGPLDAGKDQTVSFMTFDPLEIAHIDCKNECNPRQSIFIEFNNPEGSREAYQTNT